MKMAINLDNKLQTVKEFVVGGKKRNVIYDDKFMTAIAEADIRIGKDLEEYIDPDKETIEKFNKKTAVQQLEIYSGLQSKVKNDLVNTLDSAFGKGAGEELYAYF
jgi:pyridoxine 5'-phosphate synthase PdxJ